MPSQVKANRADGGKAWVLSGVWDHFRQLAPLTPLICIPTLRAHPLITDMVKTRLQSGNAQYTGPISAASSILKNEGVAGFYRGAFGCLRASLRRLHPLTGAS